MDDKSGYTGSYDGSPRAPDHQVPLLSRSPAPTFADDEHHWVRTGERGATIAPRTAIREYWWLILAGLLGVVIGLQLVIWHDISSSARVNLLQVGGDADGMGPTFPTKTLKWNADPEFAPPAARDFLKPDVQRKWESLLPDGAGFVGAEALAYNSTSVTHQIHCVYIMGKIFASLLTGSPDMPEADDYEAHFLHCVDYMRQAAMCAGDLAIEPRGENGQPGPINLVNAFNGLHVCKDYTKVKGYLQEQLNDGARNILPLDD